MWPHFLFWFPLILSILAAGRSEMKSWTSLRKCYCWHNWTHIYGNTIMFTCEVMIVNGHLLFKYHHDHFILGNSLKIIHLYWLNSIPGGNFIIILQYRRKSFELQSNSLSELCIVPSFFVTWQVINCYTEEWQFHLQSWCRVESMGHSWCGCAYEFLIGHEG